MVHAKNTLKARMSRRCRNTTSALCVGVGTSTVVTLVQWFGNPVRLIGCGCYDSTTCDGLIRFLNRGVTGFNRGVTVNLIANTILCVVYGCV